jgi:Pentapeptide repeats (8 copies)
VKVWNRWRKENPHVEINLKLADLSHTDLTFAQLAGADLTRANLSKATLRKTNLTDAKLVGAKLYGAWLVKAKLTGATMTRADLSKAILRIFYNNGIHTIAYDARPIISFENPTDQQSRSLTASASPRLGVGIRDGRSRGMEFRARTARVGGRDLASPHRLPLTNCTCRQLRQHNDMLFREPNIIAA